jgi:toluene monooxygenase system ferredoxin subunit
LGWQRLCSAQEVATGGLTGIEVQGVKVLVARVGDAFVAFPPLCPHMAEPLEISGVCADGMLTCTKHIWQWDLKSGEPRGEAEKPLLYYPVRLQDGDIWIDFGRELTYDYDD